MIDHVSVGVADLKRAATFYDAVFAPLGIARMMERPTTIGYGKAYPEFWINLREGMTRLPDNHGTHICLRARSIEHVTQFYDAALANGGRDDGKPGPRPEYHPTYYAAFIVDPDGNRIELVTFLKDENG